MGSYGYCTYTETMKEKHRTPCNRLQFDSVIQLASLQQAPHVRGLSWQAIFSNEGKLTEYKRTGRRRRGRTKNGRCLHGVGGLCKAKEDYRVRANLIILGVFILECLMFSREPCGVD